MPSLCSRIAASLAGLVLMSMGPVGPAAAAPPTCRGQNMLETMRTADPVSHGRIMDAGRATANGEAMLWRVERAGLQPSYLFGTMHISDPRLTTLSPAVLQAVRTSKSVALEIADMSPTAMRSAGGLDPDLMISRAGRGLAQLIGPEDFAAAKAAMAPSGMPEATLRSMRPWVITMSLALPLCEQRRTAGGAAVLDQKLGDEARARAIPVVGLETLESQLRMMAAVPEDQQVQMLRAAIKYADVRDDMLETMAQMYLKRQIGAVWEFNLVLAEKVGIGAQAFDGFEKDLVVGRNRSMRDTARPYLDKGGLFIGVGAMHLVGRDGLVAMLREAGFTVTAVE
jgi:uncharacterized protein